MCRPRAYLVFISGHTGMWSTGILMRYNDHVDLAVAKQCKLPVVKCNGELFFFVPPGFTTTLLLCAYQALTDVALSAPYVDTFVQPPSQGLLYSQLGHDVYQLMVHKLAMRRGLVLD